ncbi:MAG: universal stress protein [Alphaproteobacteria bacterium]
MSDLKTAIMKAERGVYLLVADKSDDFTTALRYAQRLSLQSQAHIGLAYIIEKQDFLHWGNIEDRMREEQRKEAEQYLFDVAGDVNAITGTQPVFYILEGDKTDALTELINEDMTIKMLVLGGDSQGGAPGPLVSFFSGKGLGQLRVPLTVVPNHLTESDIDSIF